jgi:hypothetical protein
VLQIRTIRNDSEFLPFRSELAAERDGSTPPLRLLETYRRLVVVMLIISR